MQNAGSTGVVPGPDAGGNESDKGSLLSHDPDDDDGEPDWLKSD